MPRLSRRSALRPALPADLDGRHARLRDRIGGRPRRPIARAAATAPVADAQEALGRHGDEAAVTAAAGEVPCAAPAAADDRCGAEAGDLRVPAVPAADA